MPLLLQKGRTRPSANRLRKGRSPPPDSRTAIIRLTSMGLKYFFKRCSNILKPAPLVTREGSLSHQVHNHAPMRSFIPKDIESNARSEPEGRIRQACRVQAGVLPASPPPAASSRAGAGLDRASQPGSGSWGPSVASAQHHSKSERKSVHRRTA